MLIGIIFVDPPWAGELFTGLEVGIHTCKTEKVFV